MGGSLFRKILYLSVSHCKQLSVEKIKNSLMLILKLLSPQKIPPICTNRPNVESIRINLHNYAPAPPEKEFEPRASTLTTAAKRWQF